MTPAPKIAFICGSLRTGSINKTLEKALMRRFKTAGAKTTAIDLGTYDLPLYHGDLTTPPAVKNLIRRLKTFDGVVVTMPEYNGGLPPVLKNMIDWTSTVETGHISGPVYGIASCTPGALSGIMGLRQLNFILARLGAHVIPVQVGCGNASNAFDGKGNLIAEPANTLADRMMAQMLARISEKHHMTPHG